MKYLKFVFIFFFIIHIQTGYSQSTDKNTSENIEKTEDTITKQNVSEEVVTKIIRIKGANGEEKVIKEQQVITKTSDLKADPKDTGKINQNTIYTSDEVVVKNISPTSNEKQYTMVPKGKVIIITFTDEKGTRISKAKKLNNEYYLISNGPKDNCIGHIDENKNLIIETFDVKNDSIISTLYKAGTF